MKYQVTVKPGSSQEKIIEVAPATDTSAGELTVYLRAKPHDGEANTALIKLLSKHLKIAKTNIQITHGAHSRVKIVEFLYLDSG
ncbi:DUF167 domain-containing protein [Candidatus Saccharibacteria bacterium]|nr:DUF167 domain-containing protein [Candidatus Saccharibacteria bacterium]